ncbi:MAG: hypothetical protein H7099_06140 [Gemmatimonadaceae bacterium]|nr:hypothetical protein [Gemmatimonadaceae bacterium]
MTNADATARTLAALGALGSVVALALIARAMARGGGAPRGLLYHVMFCLGVLVYGTGRALAGPHGVDMSVGIVAGAMMCCGAIGIVSSHRAASVRDSEGSPSVER